MAFAILGWEWCLWWNLLNTLLIKFDGTAHGWIYLENQKNYIIPNLFYSWKSQGRLFSSVNNLLTCGHSG